MYPYAQRRLTKSKHGGLKQVYFGGMPEHPKPSPANW